MEKPPTFIESGPAKRDWTEVRMKTEVVITDASGILLYSEEVPPDTDHEKWLAENEARVISAIKARTGL
jgi:hypothetical protein